MINEQEKTNIIHGFKNIQSTIQQLLLALSILENKKEIINRLILSKSSYNISYFNSNFENLLKSKNILFSLKQGAISSPALENDMTKHYKTFLLSEIATFNPNQIHLLDPNSYQQLMTLINKQDNSTINLSSEDGYRLDWLYSLPEIYLQHINSISDKLTKIYIFNQLKNIQGNIIMIGANGSGKSTFARQLNGKLSNNVVILSAQRLLFYSKGQNISATGNEIQEVRNFQVNSKLGSDSNLSSLLSTDMDKLVNALVSEYADCAFNLYENNQKNISYLSRTIALWKSIIEHRELKSDRTGIFVIGQNITPYPFNHLSDGEKAVFYYIGHILLAAPNSYIIVDEPENHLHLVICNKLWDCLEQERSDCKFIYLTHNLDFATTRTDSTILWNKSFLPPSQWNFEILPSTEAIPEVLVMELVGSRKNICFCEGDNKSSLDYKLYSILFPNYTIIPVSGHRNVIDYTDAYNKNPSFVTNAIGVVDGDCHLPEQIEKWKEKKIFVLNINEIENLLCDPLILETASSTFFSEETSLTNFYNRFWTLYESDKDKQAALYVNNYINAKFRDNYLTVKNDISSLKEELNKITSSEEADILYHERLSYIEALIDNKSYEEALRIANFKGRLTRELTRTIVDRYENRVLDLIKKNITLKESIIEKYFANLEELESK